MDEARMKIQHQYDNQGGAFFIERNGVRIAELTYRTFDRLLDANHTRVDPQLRGQRLADQLYQAFIEFVDQGGYNVRPSCSYIEAKMRKEKRI
jgi:predicted GNAT family acetyltransferase